jgi:ABC-2 type transport system ATP-binding protein
MWTMIEGLRDAGKTIFLTTHYMDEAQHLADRIIILRAGVIAAEGTAEELSTRLGYHTEVTFESPGAFDPARLAALLGVEVTYADPLVRFRTDHVQSDLATLLEWARIEAVELVDLQAIRPSLDDVFVQLAGEADAAQGRPS